MKVASIALFSVLSVPSIDCIGFRGVANKITAKSDAIAKSDTEIAAFLEDLQDEGSDRRRLVADDCATESYFYVDWSSNSWATGTCSESTQCIYNTFATAEDCCAENFKNQPGNACYNAAGLAPTESPTTVNQQGTGSTGTAGFYYPDYDTAWSEAGCLNTLPLPYTHDGDRPEYETLLLCCKGAYGNQMSGACLAALPNQPTNSPTTVELMESGGTGYYTLRDGSYEEQTCINTQPLPTGLEWWNDNLYGSMLECCQKEYGNQLSGACLANLPEAVRPTDSPTTVGLMEAGGTGFYTLDASNWATGICINTMPLPAGQEWQANHLYDTLLECCQAKFPNQSSGACVANLPNPPTESPTTVELMEAGGTSFYGDSSQWATGTCTNTPVPNDWFKLYDTQEECCTETYPSQTDSVCLCDMDPCYSCSCSGAATNSACPNLTCD